MPTVKVKQNSAISELVCTWKNSHAQTQLKFFSLTLQKILWGSLGILPKSLGICYFPFPPKSASLLENSCNVIIQLNIKLIKTKVSSEMDDTSGCLSGKSVKCMWIFTLLANGPVHRYSSVRELRCLRLT